jgi:hypothetical protein
VTKDEITTEQLEKKMAGGKELARLEAEFKRTKATGTGPVPAHPS